MAIDKLKFGMYVIGIVATLQGIAWITGHNGAIFNFTSLVIGGVAGTLLGFTYNRATK